MPFLGPDRERNAPGAGRNLALLGMSGLYGQGYFPEFEDEMRRVQNLRRNRPPVECPSLRVEGCARLGSVRLLWFVAK